MTMKVLSTKKLRSNLQDCGNFDSKKSNEY